MKIKAKSILSGEYAIVAPPPPPPPASGSATNGFNIAWHSAQVPAAQKRSYYPPGVFTFVDAVADLGCDPNGNVDCTSILNNFIASIDWNFAEGQPSNAVNRMLKFPTGTFLVSGELFGDAAVTIEGAGSDLTFIRLKPYSTGYGDPNTPKAVARWGHGHHDTYRNYMRDFAISIGEGNPGAVGFAYTGHNNSGIQNIVVIDEANTALLGFSFGRHPAPIPTRTINVAGNPNGINDRVAVGIHQCSELEVRGCKRGISLVDSMGASLGLFNITLTNQRSEAIYAEVGGTLQFHNVNQTTSYADCHGFVQNNATGARSLSFTKCKFDRTVDAAPGVTGIKLISRNGQEGDCTVHIHNSSISTRYNKGVTFNATEIHPTGAIAEFIKAPASWGGTPAPAVYAVDFTPQVKSAINVSHDEIRYYAYADSASWTLVPNNPTVAQVQTALNGQNPAVLFQGGSVRLNSPVSIPSGINLVNFARTGIHFADSNATTNATYLIDVLGSPSDPPLEIRSLPGIDGNRGDGSPRHFIIRNRGGRTLILNSITCSGLMLHGTPGICIANHLLCSAITIGDGWKFLGLNVDVEQRGREILTPDELSTHDARFYIGKNAIVSIRNTKFEACETGFDVGEGSTVQVEGLFYASNNDAVDAPLFNGRGDGIKFSLFCGWLFGGAAYRVLGKMKRGGISKTLRVDPQNPTAAHYVNFVERSS